MTEKDLSFFFCVLQVSLDLDNSLDRLNPGQCGSLNSFKPGYSINLDM